MDAVHLGIFLKSPRPGNVKTRLCPPLAPAEAAELYTALLADTLGLAAASSAAGVILFHEGPAPHTYIAPSLLEALPGSCWEVPQRGDDLGERLAAAVADAAGGQLMPLLLVGSDSPDLPARHLEEALATLPRYDVVLGPAADGGVWCIGVRTPVAGLFDDIPWSSARAGESLRNHAAELALNVGEVSSWWDVDSADDLRKLAQRLRSRGAQAPVTRRLLARWSEGTTPLARLLGEDDA